MIRRLPLCLVHHRCRSPSSFIKTYLPYRNFSTNDDKQNPTKKEQNDNAPSSSSSSPSSQHQLIDSTIRGAGQVIFCNSPRSGLLITASLACADPYLATLATIGSITSTTTASVSNLDEQTRLDGLWGYNGFLVGCATSVFVSPLMIGGDQSSWSETMMMISGGLTTTVMGSMVAPFVSAALKPAMGSVPQWTFSFNLVMLTVLLRTRPFLGHAAGGGEEDGTTEVAAPSSLSLDPMMMWMEAPFKGLSQIFVVESTWSGLGLLGAIALYSPGLAGHALLGSTIGATTGYFLTTTGTAEGLSEIGMGLWGFNSALTSMGIGTFYVHSNRTVLLSMGGAAATAAVFGAMKTVFGGWDVPCLTLPFCVTMSGCYLMNGTVPGLLLAKDPHSPEMNKV